jgi:predicted amidophosphoribosyltransferase
MAKHRKNKFCSRCGKPLRAADRFCAACGSKASNKFKRLMQSKKKQNWILITGTGVVLAFVIIIIVTGMISSEQKLVGLDRNNGQIASIAAEFDCSCEECDKTLQNCYCPTAKETFEFIARQINKEQYSRLEIIKKVNDRYGYLKNKSILDG